MKQQRHINYYQTLLLAGATVLKPVTMKGGAEKGKGRMWEASAKLRFKGHEIFLKASFFGGMTETEETCQANLIIERIRTTVEGAGLVEFTRASYRLLMLVDGIYICPDHTPEVCAKMYDIANYNTNLYMGIPSDEEMEQIFELGYTQIINWQ